MEMKFVDTSAVRVGYEEHGKPGGRAVILLHGFPYDVRCFDEVAPRLAQAGCHVLVPYLRGFGPSRFLNAATPRSGQQGALARDLLEFADRLGLDRPILAGFDWGGRAACAAAALWPDRFGGLLTAGGNSIYNIESSREPAPPEVEHILWYQYYFHGERGRAGFTRNRKAFCRLLWTLWSPQWAFDDETFERTATSFENPDFPEVAVHSYRHRFGLAEGDPAYEELERRLSQRPPVAIPTVVLMSGAGILGMKPPTQSDLPAMLWCKTAEGAGHNVPQERPLAFVEGVMALLDPQG